MSHELVDIRTLLAASDNARVEIGRNGIVHVLAGPITLHVDRSTCEELTTTLARAMVLLAKLHPKCTASPLRLVHDAKAIDASVADGDARDS